MTRAARGHTVDVGAIRRALDWSGDRDDFVEFLSNGLAGGYRLPYNDLIEPSAPDSVR